MYVVKYVENGEKKRRSSRIVTRRSFSSLDLSPRGRGKKTARGTSSPMVSGTRRRSGDT